MSAAPAAIPQPKPEKTHAARIPLPFFYLTIPKAEKVCLGLIAERTLGWGKKQEHIPRPTFERTTNVGYDTITDALSRLRDRGLVRIIECFDEKNNRRRDEYQSTIENAPADTAIGECEECKATGVIDLKKGIFDTPHSYLTLLPACVSDSVWTIVGLIMIRTCFWRADTAAGAHRFVTEWRPIRSLELEDEACLESTAVAETLKEARRLRLIEVQAHRGKTTLFRVCVDPMGNFPKLPRLNPKVISIRHNAGQRRKGAGEQPAKQVAEDLSQLIDVTEETPSDETVQLWLPGFCRNCKVFSRKRIIAMPLLDNSPPQTYARAGPPPPKEPKFKPKEEVGAELQEIYACVARWSRGFSVTPSVELARAVSDVMQGCPIELVERRFDKRREAIKAARSPGILVSLARDAGEYFLVSQAYGFDPLKYEEPEPPPKPKTEREQWIEDASKRIQANIDAREAREARDAQRR